MSLAQQIRDAMRRLGGPATSAEIAEQLEDENAGPKVAKHMHVAVQQGWAAIDREERPYRYTLVEGRAAKVEAFGSKNPHVVHAAQSAGKKRKAGAEKRQLVRRQIRAVHAKTPSEIDATRTTTELREIDPGNPLPVPRHLLLLVCALALSPDEPSSMERRLLADLIKAAA